MQNIVQKTSRAALIVTALATIAACAPEGGVGQFYREAGAQLETADFGNSTLHNQLVQTCKRTGGAGGKAGNQIGDPLVVLDPKSKPTRPIYRVHCDGRLDGKYATVIYNEYVASAVQAADVQRADSE
ncbi:MAG: hypothetical protein AB8B47_14015 [Roseobacter sp.]